MPAMAGVVAGRGNPRPSLALPDAAPVFINAVPPGGTNGVAYSYQFTASGSPAAVFTLNSGTLPTGVTLSASGLLAGTPSSTATFTFTVKAANGVAPDAVTGSLQVIISASGIPAAPADQPIGLAANDTIVDGSWAWSTYTDAQLIDLRDNWGIKGFMFGQGFMNLGAGNYAGDYDYTTNLTATFNSADGRINAGTAYDRWSFGRAMKYGNDGNTATPTVGNGNFITRCHGLGLEVYAGAYMIIPGVVSPLRPWWDDAQWTNYLSSSSGFIQLVQYINAWGLDGLWLDDECFAADGVTAPTWSWNYGHPNDEVSTRAKVRARGIQMAQAVAAIKPNLKILEYNTTGHAGFQDDWDEDIVQNAAGRGTNVKQPKVERDFWRGFLSEPTFTGTHNTWAATFYRDTGVAASWFGAMQYDIVNVMATASRYFGADWDQAHAKMRRHPFFWPGRASNASEDHPVSVATAADQWASARLIGMGEMGYYIQTGFPDYDIIYQSAIKAGSVPGTVNSNAPTFSVAPTSGFRVGNNITITGTAAHAYGIWYISWDRYNAGGTAIDLSGAFGHDFVPGAHDYTNAAGYDDATYPFSGTINAPAGRYVRITAVSVKGQSHAVVIQV